VPLSLFWVLHALCPAGQGMQKGFRHYFYRVFGFLRKKPDYSEDL